MISGSDLVDADNKAAVQLFIHWHIRNTYDKFMTKIDITQKIPMKLSDKKDNHEL